MQALLADMGVTVRKKNIGKVDFANIRLDYKEDGAVINMPVLKNTSLYQAGLNRGDKILEINNQAVKNAADFKSITEKITAGRGCDITFVQNGITQSVKFTALEDPALEILLQEKPSDAASKKRKEWLKK